MHYCLHFMLQLSQGWPRLGRTELCWLTLTLIRAERLPLLWASPATRQTLSSDCRLRYELSEPKAAPCSWLALHGSGDRHRGGLMHFITALYYQAPLMNSTNAQNPAWQRSPRSSSTPSLSSNPCNTSCCSRVVLPGIDSTTRQMAKGVYSWSELIVIYSWSETLSQDLTVGSCMGRKHCSLPCQELACILA